MDETSSKIGIPNKIVYSNSWLVALLLTGALLTWSLYSVSLKGDFVFDDFNIIHDNAAIQSFPDPRPLLKSCQTRFLSHLSLSWNFYYGKFQPVYYHLFNLALHFLNSILVLLLSALLWNAANRKEKNSSFSQKLFCSLVFLGFLMHPVQAHAVNYISQRGTLLVAFFYLASVYLFLRFRATNKFQFKILSLASTICAMLTKETSFTIPVVIALADFTLYPQTRLEKRGRDLFPFLLCLLIIPVLLMVSLRAGQDIAGISMQTNLIPRHHYLFTQIHVIIDYLRLLVFPAGQSIDYQYPLVTSLASPVTLTYLVTLVAAIIWAVINIRRIPLMSFAILWFFITLSVESSIIPIDDVIQTYRLYLPSLGFLWLLAAGMEKIMLDHRLKILLAGTVLIFFSSFTLNRNILWQNEVTLLSDALQKAPQKERIKLNLMRAYLRQGDFTNAYYLQTEIIPPELTDFSPWKEHELPGLPYEMLILNEIEKNNLQLAVLYARMAYWKCENADILTALGSLMAWKNYNNLAYALFLKALALDNSLETAYLEFAKNLANFDNHTMAIRLLELGLLQNPHSNALTDLKTAIRRIQEKQYVLR
ncbi:MAG: hypothetical protein AB1650_04165 [Candidatus Omnitrophota bacterium]